MSFNEFLALFLLIFLIVLLYKEIFHPVVSFFIVISVSIIFRLISIDDFFKVFSNKQIALIGILLITTSILEKQKVLESIFSKLISLKLTYKKFFIKVLPAVSFLSAFLNNTPIVATLIPFVYNWAKRKNIHPSKVLIPISYAAILGGTLTVIGTSTNMIINGFLESYHLKTFNVFDFTFISLPAVILGLFYLVVFSPKLLPEREDPIDILFKKRKDYIVETIVPKGSKIINQTVKEAKLRNLKGLFLAEIIRNNNYIRPVSPTQVIKEGDILIFVGDTSSIVEVLKNKNLALPNACKLDVTKNSSLVEALVPANSPLIGKKVRDTDFRGRFDGAILAVHRNGEKLKGKIGEIKIKAGDLLLILAGKDFFKKLSNELYVINKIDFNVESGNKVVSILFLIGFLIILLLSTFNILPLIIGLLIFITIAILLKVISYQEIKSYTDIDILLIAYFSLALGKILENSGIAKFVSDSILDASNLLGITGSLILIYIITNILTEFLTNIAAASIMFPIALTLANSFNVSFTPFVLAVMFAASASFITPIGYQTNLLVFNVGNYKFKDFLKVGFPLTIIYGLCIIIILKLVYL